MKLYKVTAHYQVWEEKTIRIKADSLEQAQEIAMKRLQDEEGAEDIILEEVL